MRPEERYWLKVGLTIGVVGLVVLLLAVLSMAVGIDRVFAGIREAFQ